MAEPEKNTVEWLNAEVLKNKTIRSVLPLGTGLIYPRITLSGESRLGIHFLSVRTKRREEGLFLFRPDFYFMFIYPGFKLVRMENLKFMPGFCEADYEEEILFENPFLDRERHDTYVSAYRRIKMDLQEVFVRFTDGDDVADAVRRYNITADQLQETIQVETYRKII